MCVYQFLLILTGLCFLFDSVNPSFHSLFKAAVEGVMPSVKTDALLISDCLVKEEQVGITEETVSV